MRPAASGLQLKCFSVPLTLADIVGTFVFAVACAAVLYGSWLILARAERWIEKDVMPVVTQKIEVWAERRL